MTPIALAKLIARHTANFRITSDRISGKCHVFDIESDGGELNQKAIIDAAFKNGIQPIINSDKTAQIYVFRH